MKGFSDHSDLHLQGGQGTQKRMHYIVKLDMKGTKSSAQESIKFSISGNTVER